MRERKDEPKEVFRINEQTSNVVERYNAFHKDMENRQHRLKVIQKEMSVSIEIHEPLEVVLSQVAELMESAPPPTMKTQQVEEHLEKIKVGG